MDLVGLLPAIEAAAVRGWPAIETADIGGWLWRYSGGGSTRANAVATLQFDGRNVEAAIDAVEARYRAAGAPSLITVSPVSAPSDLDLRLGARGYKMDEQSVTMAKRVDPSICKPAAVAVTAALSEEWTAIYLSGLSDGRRAKAQAILDRLPAGCQFITASHEGRAITTGLTIADGTVASVQCMATWPEYRRNGGAQKVLAAIESLAAQGGQTALYLQTGAENESAQMLYRRTGFLQIGTYHTWRRDT